MSQAHWEHRDDERLSWQQLRPALMVFVALSVLDALVSGALLHAGTMREANPLMHMSLEHLGLPATLGLKLFITAGAAGVLLGVRRELAGVLPALLWAASGCYALLWAMVIFLG